MPYKNIRSKSFNKQTSLASWDVFNMSFPMQVRTLKIDKIGQNWNVKLSFVIHPHPQKQYLEHMGATLSLSHFSVYQFFNLFPFFGPTKQYVQRWKKVDMWSRCCKFNPPRPYKTIRSLYAESYHMVSFWKFTTSSNLQDRTVDGIYAHWTIHSNTFNIWIKLTCWFILLDLPALSPTKHYV